MGSSSKALTWWSRGVPGGPRLWELPKKSKRAGRSAMNFDHSSAQTRMTAPQAGPWVTEVARSSASE